MTTFEKIIKNLNRIEGELAKPESERRDSLPICSVECHQARFKIDALD